METQEVNNEVSVFTKDDIMEMICQYDGKLILFDFCLAKIFNYSIKHLNQNINNNENKYNKEDILKIERDKAKEIVASSLTFNGVSLTFDDVSLTFGITFGKKYKPTIFTKEGVEFIAGLLKKETVKYYLPIILEAFEEVEIDNQIALKMAENHVKSSIHDKIYTIRGQQVMLDFDLSPLYGYEVKKFNQQVKRNIERFPKSYAFQLNELEFEQILKSQFVTSSWGGTRKLPYAFTEKGVLALSSVLNSQKAIEQSHYIIEQFILMRGYIRNQIYMPQQELSQVMPILLEHETKINNLDNELRDIIKEHDNQGRVLENILNLLEGHNFQKEFTFNNQLFEADVVYKDIYSQANHSIYVIDNYVSIKTLSHLKCKKENVDVIIFSDNLGRNDKLQQVEIDDFNKEYPSLILKSNGISHDRYIIIDYKTDNEKIYHSGASIKDAGKKLCSITQIHDTHIFHQIIEQLLL